MFKKIGKWLKKSLYPLVKAAKPYIKEWARKELIPKLQKKVNAGAKNVDKAIDKLIKESVLDLIDQL